jgi:colicin import membrane protein
MKAQQQAVEAGTAAQQALEGQIEAEKERLRNAKSFIDLRGRETEAAKTALIETSKGFNTEAQRAALAVVNNQKNRKAAEQTLRAYKDTSAALNELLFQEGQVAELEETRTEIQKEIASIQADQDVAIKQQTELLELAERNAYQKKKQKDDAEAEKAAEKARAEAQRQRDKEKRDADKLAAEQAKILQEIQAKTAALEDESLRVTLQIIDTKAQLGTVEDQITAKFNKQIVSLQQQKQAKIDQLDVY